MYLRTVPDGLDDQTCVLIISLVVISTDIVLRTNFGSKR